MEEYDRKGVTNMCVHIIINSMIFCVWSTSIINSYPLLIIDNITLLNIQKDTKSNPLFAVRRNDLLKELVENNYLFRFSLEGYIYYAKNGNGNKGK